MLRCVDMSRGVLETPSPTGNILMQLKMTALTSTRLCVRDGQDGEGGYSCPPGPPHPSTHRPIPEGANLLDQKTGGFLGAEPREAGRSHGLWAGKEPRLAGWLVGTVGREQSPLY